MNQRMSNISVAALFEELTSRVLQLQGDAERPGSIGQMRSLLVEAYEAGRAAGITNRSGEAAQRLQRLLDEASARMPDLPPAGIDGTDPALAYWRTGRQHLWQLVEGERVACQTEAQASNRQAAERQRRLDHRIKSSLQPEPSLRVRAGRWLYTIGARIGERGAS